MNAVSWRTRLRRLCLALAVLAPPGCGDLSGDEPVRDGLADGIVVPGRPAPPVPVRKRPHVQPPGVREVAPGRYEVIVHAYNWGLNPTEVRVPAGAEVTFRALSLEGGHGFSVADTPIALWLWTDREAEATHTFAAPGEYPFLCFHYCGGGHGMMVGRLLVE